MSRRLTIRGEDGVVRRARRKAGAVARAMLDTLRCKGKCCDCWRRATLCNAPPCDDPANRYLWLHCDVKCTGGAPIDTGSIVKIDDSCWRVEPGTAKAVPDGEQFVPKGMPISCVENCLECPTYPRYIVGQPCDPDAIGPTTRIPVIDRCTYGGGCFTAKIDGGCWTFNPLDNTGGLPDEDHRHVIDPDAIPPEDKYDDCCNCLGDLDPPQCEPADQGIPSDPCNPDSPRLRCCCNPDDQFEITAFGETVSEYRLIRHPDFRGGGYSEAWATYTITLGSPLPGIPNVYDATVTFVQLGITHSADGSVISTNGPTTQTFSIYLFIMSGCVPQIRAYTSIGNEFEWPFGSGYYDAQGGSSAPCSYSTPRDGGTETVTATYALGCLSSSYSATGTIDRHIRPTQPGDGEVIQRNTATRHWTAIRIPSPGPCSGGCHESGDAIAMKAGGTSGGCAGCGGGLRGDEV